MIDDIKNSFKKIVNERISSPFYGSFILSWFVWNWKIIFLIFFVDEDNINTDKVSYISEKFSDFHHLVTFPLISTILLIALIPYISNRAYWISLIYKQWRVNKRNTIEKKELLTLEQSSKIRMEIISQEKRFNELLENKNLTIKQLKNEIETYQNKKEVSGKEVLNIVEKEIKNVQNDDINKIANKIKENDVLYEALSKANSFVQGRYSGLGQDNNINNDALDYFVASDMIELQTNGTYKWTKKGKKINFIISDAKFE